jgi:hydrogenase-4 component B
VLCAGAAAGVAGALLALQSPLPPEVQLPWAAPGGSFSLRVDPLSALFLLPVLIVPALGSVYGLAYYPQARLGGTARGLQLWYGLVTASMALLVTSANAILFLVAWEVMALCAFLLVLTEQEAPEARRAAYVYLASAHAGTLALFGLFALLGRLAGSYQFARMAGLVPSGGLATAAFLLALGGFGLKAGLLPLHFWLPGAHAAAPSHVSALLSGVLLKTGIYGLLRVTAFFGPPPSAWGATLLLAGAASAVLGVAFALAQHDLKRLLAYHSVENIGIIAMGLGLALIGRARGDPALVLLGFGGAVLHVINHATFKALLFYGAGAVIHATGTREIDRLGGLGRAMPRAAALFLVGAAAISGLPPLNGFASEWLVFLGSLRTVLNLGPEPHPHYAVLVAPVLALVGGLAAACFVKVFGTVFLGQARAPDIGAGHEPPLQMLLPMALLAAACLLVGLLPAAILPTLAWAAAGPSRSWGGSPDHPAAALLGLTLGLWVLRRSRLPGPQPRAETWGCGYAHPTPRMQYTGSSFAEMLVVRFGWALFPRARVVPPQGPFPQRASFSTSFPDTVLDAGLVPALDWLAAAAARTRWRLLGTVQVQALLLVGGVMALLAWLALGGPIP